MDSTLQDWVPKTPTSAITQGFLLLWVSLVAQTVKNPPAMPETWVRSLGQIPGRSPGEGLGKPLQDSRLRNPMDRGAQWDTVLQRVRHGRAAITFIFFFHFPLLYLLKINENIYKSSSLPKRTGKRGPGNCTLLQVKKRLTFLRISSAWEGKASEMPLFTGWSFRKQLLTEASRSLSWSPAGNHLPWCSRLRSLISRGLACLSTVILISVSGDYVLILLSSQLPP